MIDEQELDVWYRAIQTDNVTAVMMEYDGIETNGDAKRNNGEVWQKGVGYDLAMGRAFINLGSALIERAYRQLPEEEKSFWTEDTMFYPSLLPDFD